MTLELATLQRGVRDLVKGRPLPAPLAADPYLEEVAGSGRLDLLREIAETWRLVPLRDTCPLTVAVLDRVGLLREELTRFTAGPGLEAHRRTAGHAFLAHVSSSPHELPAAVAGFELAVQRAASAGEAQPVVQHWPCDPLPVLRALLTGQPLGIQRSAPHDVEIAARLPGGFRVIPCGGVSPH